MYAGVAVAVAAAIGGAAVLLHGGHPASQAAGTMTRTATPPASARAAGRGRAEAAPSHGAAPAVEPRHPRRRPRPCR